MPRRWSVAVLALAMGVGTACSSGSGAGSTASGDVGPAGAAGGSTAAPAATSGGDSEYCGLARQYFKVFERFGQAGAPLEIRSFYRDAVAALDRGREVAPAEIKTDLDVVADTLKALVAGLEGIGYDFQQVASLPPGLISRLRSQQFIDSSTRVLAYSRDQCGIS